jgi:hypothetical protein
MTCIPAYKSPTANIPVNTKFNHCIAKSRVQNKHSIGILKGCWASLQQLCLALNTKKDMKEMIGWISACIILHNLLAQLGDTWDNLDEDVSHANQLSAPESTSQIAKDFRNTIQEKCFEFNHCIGTLPIWS